MTEYEKVREQIAKTLFVSYQNEIKAQLEADTKVIGMLTGKKVEYKSTGWSKLGEEYKELYRNQADRILSLDGIKIRADDQSLPELPHPLEHSLDYRDGALSGQEKMLEARFVKVALKPKEVKRWPL